MNMLGRVGLTLKLDELLLPSMTFEVILIETKYLGIYDISIHINFYQNRFINECVRKKKKVWQIKTWLLKFVTFNDLWCHTYLNEIFADSWY